MWASESIPDDWIETVIIVLSNGIDNINDCGNSRGLSLLSVAGNFLCGVLLDRLLNHVTNRALPGSQSGFRVGHGTPDMIFSASKTDLVCHDNFLALVRSFEEYMKARINVRGEILGPISIKME